MIRRRTQLHRHVKFASGCLALLFVAAGCGTKTPPDTRTAYEAAIRDLDAQWSKIAATKNVDGAVAFYADDASLLPPNAPIAADKQSIRSIWTDLLSPNISLSWLSTKVEAARSGDLAYSTGSYQLTEKSAQGKFNEDHGKFLEVWKKQPDGKWKCVADVYNSDFPVAAPAPAPEKPKARHHQARKKHHAKKRSNAN